MTEIYSDSFPLDETICKHCIYRMSKLITPIDPEEFGLSEEDIEQLDLPEGEELTVEQHTCLINYQDMDYIVKECNHFKPVEAESFFRTNPYE